MRIGLVVVALLLAATLTAGCPPKRNFTTQKQVNAVQDFEELMWFLATVADPGFKLADKEPAELAAADFVRFADIGQRAAWGAARLSEGRFSRDAEFNALGQSLGQASDALRAGAVAKDAAAAIKAARAMKGACAACHKKYR